MTRRQRHDGHQLLEHQGCSGMKVLFLESHVDWSISWIRMAPRRKLRTREWLVRREVDLRVIGQKSCGVSSFSLRSACEENAWQLERGVTESS